MAALVIALVVGMCAAMPVFAQEGKGSITRRWWAAPPSGRHVPLHDSIQWERDKPAIKEHLCGGTLIDEDSVLAAAHCADVIAGGRTRHTNSEKRGSSSGRRRSAVTRARSGISPASPTSTRILTTTRVPARTTSP